MTTAEIGPLPDLYYAPHPEAERWLRKVLDLDALPGRCPPRRQRGKLRAVFVGVSARLIDTLTSTRSGANATPGLRFLR